ncbi:fucolectin-like [Sinocyclocheilus rhinocerous]|uniref:fucolectin-like n=1 Tax=Sinocyclocheilus rhinocerous TaxID=307959 RepID=UPI0007B7E071|nr:PREDICTED: fucolectin-like [Sinocyclocheilus rhinocerous]
MFSASCAATNVEARPWWRLDLQAAHRVSIVVVTYREDCCPNNRKDFEIHFGNSLQDEGNDNPSCAMISSDSAVNSITHSCSDREGRYIHVFSRGYIILDFKALLVCEVEVYETEYFRRSFMKIAFNSTANLTDPTVTDSVLKELKSALALRGITNVTLSWSQNPAEAVIHNQREKDAC